MGVFDSKDLRLTFYQSAEYSGGFFAFSQRSKSCARHPGLYSNLEYTACYLSAAVLVRATELLLSLDAQPSELITSDYNLHTSFKWAAEKHSEVKT